MLIWQAVKKLRTPRITKAELDNMLETTFTGQKYIYTIKNGEEEFEGYSNKSYTPQMVALYASVCLGMAGEMIIVVREQTER